MQVYFSSTDNNHQVVNIKSSIKQSIIIMINNNAIIIKNNSNIEGNDTFSNINNHDIDLI